MKCRKCGHELKEGWHFCPKCSLSINNEVDDSSTQVIENKEIEQQKTYDYGGKDKICITIFLISMTCVFLVKQISFIAFFVALITIVTGFLKYPENKVIKVFIWLFIAGIILFFIFFIIAAFVLESLMMTCLEGCA